MLDAELFAQWLGTKLVLVLAEMIQRSADDN